MKKVSTIWVKKTTTSVRMVDSQRTLLIAAARQEGISIGEFIRRATSERSARILAIQELQLRQPPVWKGVQ